MLIPKPERIQVGARYYQIIVDPKLVLREGLVGVCDHEGLTIYIQERDIKESQTEVFWHESAEAINSVFLANSLSHNEVSALAQGIHQVFSSLGIEIDWER